MRSIKIFISLIVFTLPILFLFQNCSRSTSFEQAPSTVVDLGANSFCESIDSVQGDMRFLFTRNTNGPSTLEFGTIADDYWSGDSTGKIEDRRLELNITHADLITQFTLENVQFDDWLNLKVNGQQVYNGPYGGDRLLRENGLIRFSATQTQIAELGTSWNLFPRIDLRPFLVEGRNIIDFRVIVAGGGEGYFKILVTGGCTAN